MNKEILIEHFSKQLYPLPEACKAEMAERTRLFQVEKKEVLVREGEHSDKMFYVAKGALRAYYLKAGKDITDWFAFEDELICPIQSFFNLVPSPHYVEAIEASWLLTFTRNDIFYLNDKYRDFERLGNIQTTQTMLQLQERIVALQFETAQQKYQNLLNKKPDIELRVPLIHIASYLGITIETLSRIRARQDKI